MAAVCIDQTCLIFARNDEAEHLEKTDGIGGVWLVYDDEWGACGIEVDNVSHELRERIFVFVPLSWVFAIQIFFAYVTATDGFLPFSIRSMFTV